MQSADRTCQTVTYVKLFSNKRGHYLCRGGSHACMVTVNSVFEALGCAFVFHTYLPRSGAQSWSILCVCVQGCVSVCVNTDLFSFVKLSSPEATIHTTKLKHTLLYANTFSLLLACWRGPNRYTHTFMGEGDNRRFLCECGSK